MFDENPPDLLIIDILGSSHDLIEAGRKSARAVITVDDLEPSAAETDAVVNGILWGTRLLPNPFGRARVYQGIEYIQLREDFAKANQNPRLHSSRVSSILISTGGADLREFTPQLMQAISKLSFDCAVSVIVGPAFHNLPSLQEAAQALSGRSNFSLVPDADDMAERLLKSDIALLTGGTVMFESAACGTPAIIVCSYENQFPQAEWFARKGMAVNLGYRPGELDQSRVVRVLEELARNPKKRGQMSEAMKATVDGRGLDRFVEIVRAAL
ncbi:MAG: glycosyltransferase [Chthoniobacterales bacterium]